MSIKLVRLFTRSNFDAELIIGSEEITTLMYFGNQKEFHLNTINTSSTYTSSGQQKSASFMHQVDLYPRIQSNDQRDISRRSDYLLQKL